MRATKNKPPRPVTELRPFEMQLLENGFECKERKKFEQDCIKYPSEDRWKNPPRFRYRKGTFIVLTETMDNPWRTVQKLSGGSVLWYVDFPLGVDTKSIIEFIGAA